MIIVDASVLTNALTDDGAVGARARAELSQDAHWAAPEHLIVEVFSAIRGRWLGRRISEQRAVDALRALSSATIDVTANQALIARMWQLRDNVTGYDAAYAAAAEAYNCPLVTADERLASAPGLRCPIVLALDPR